MRRENLGGTTGLRAALSVGDAPVRCEAVCRRLPVIRYVPRGSSAAMSPSPQRGKALVPGTREYLRFRVPAIPALCQNGFNFNGLACEVMTPVSPFPQRGNVHVSVISGLATLRTFPRSGVAGLWALRRSSWDIGGSRPGEEWRQSRGEVDERGVGCAFARREVGTL